MSNDRSCIFPEVNRVYTFGEQGTSGGQFFSDHLGKIALQKQALVWNATAATDVQLQPYKRQLYQTIRSGERIVSSQLSQQSDSQLPAVITYTSLSHFNRIARPLGIITDHKDGRPRTSFEGIVQVRLSSRVLFLVPDSHPVLQGVEEPSD